MNLLTWPVPADPRCETQAGGLCGKSDVAEAARLGECVQGMYRTAAQGREGQELMLVRGRSHHHCPAPLPMLAAAGMCRARVLLRHNGSSIL